MPRCGGAGLLHLGRLSGAGENSGELPAEVMVAPFADHALDVAARCDVIVAGPGLGRTPAARVALLRLLGVAAHKPWILDAGALYHLAHERFELPDQCLLTPHEGEALRLVGEDPLVGTWGGDRFSLAQQLSARFGVDVLLKGAGNIITLDGVSCLVPGSATRLARRLGRCLVRAHRSGRWTRRLVRGCGAFCAEVAAHGGAIVGPGRGRDRQPSAADQRDDCCLEGGL